MRRGRAGRRSIDHVWRDSLLVVLLVGGAYLWISFFWREQVEHLLGWEVPGDVWNVVRQAQYVESGAIAYVYEVPGQYALPLFPTLLAPVVAVGDHFHLVTGYPARLFWPSMWPLIALCCVPLGVFPLVAARRLMASAKEAGSFLLSLALGIVVLVPTYHQGHYEDLLALACVLVAIRRLERDPVSRAGPLWLAAALLFKQWAVLAVPCALGATPAAHRVRTAAIALLPAGVLASILLVADFRHASVALLRTPTAGGHPLGHVVPVIAAKGGEITTSPFRVAVVIGAVAVGAVVARRHAALPAALCVVFLGRALLEPVTYAYYFSPGLALAMVEAWRTGRHRGLVAGAGSFAIWWTFVTTVPRVAWFVTMTGVMAVASIPAVREIWSAHEHHPPSVRSEPELVG